MEMTGTWKPSRKVVCKKIPDVEKEEGKVIRSCLCPISKFIGLNNSDYFVMFNRDRDELQNYYSLFPLIHGWLCNLKKIIRVKI